jgi:hypothetical protein
VFDIETRIVQRYITPGCTYKGLQIERTDFLPTCCGELVDRKPCSEQFPGPSREPERAPLHRYSAFPRQGEYVVPTNRKLENLVLEYANMRGRPAHQEPISSALYFTRGNETLAE